MPPSRARILTFYLLGLFLDLINTYIASVASPVIGKALGASVAEVAWISTAYVLGLTLAIPASTWLAQRLGLKSLLIGSLVLFGVATGLTAVATDIGSLLGLRFIQGAGGGLFIPAGQALVYAQYRREERPQLATLILAVGLIAPALSPMIGGFIVSTLSWHWVFLCTLPPTVIAIGLGLWLLPKDGERSSNVAFDFKGFAMGVPALALMLLGLTDFSEGKFAVGFSQVVAAIGFAAMYLWHYRRSDHPLLDLSLLEDRLLRFGVMIYHAITGLFIGINILAMLYLQDVLGVSPTKAGSLMLPWTLGAGIGIFLNGKLYRRVGPSLLLAVGAILQAIGFFLLSRSTEQSDMVLLGTIYGLMGFGGSICTSTAQSGAFMNIPIQRLNQASALWGVNRQVAFCSGVTVTSVTFSLLANVVEAAAAYRITFFIAALSVVIPVYMSIRIRRQSA